MADSRGGVLIFLAFFGQSLSLKPSRMLRMSYCFPKNFIYKFQSQFDSVFGLIQQQSFTVQGRIQKIQKEVAGTHNSSILDTVYFSATEFYENNTTFQRKKGGCSPLGSPLKSTHAVMAKCPVIIIGRESSITLSGVFLGRMGRKNLHSMSPVLPGGGKGGYPILRSW